MMISIDGLQAQGEALPATARHGTIHPAGGLDNHQQGWRIRHPQAVTELGQFVSIPPISSTLLGIYLFLGAWVGSQRKRPHCACLARHCFAATRSAIVSMSYGLPTMIYTFLIATNRGRIADFQRIRTISAFAKSETEARQRLAGLPLVFLSRSPAQEVAA